MKKAPPRRAAEPRSNVYLAVAVAAAGRWSLPAVSPVTPSITKSIQEDGERAGQCTGHAQLEIGRYRAELRANGRNVAQRRADIGSAMTVAAARTILSLGIEMPAIRPSTTSTNATFSRANGDKSGDNREQM